jgi:DNA-binding MarR family transcriptional regulator
MRRMLHEMELDLGLARLTRNERDVLLAFHELAKFDNGDLASCSTDVVRSHPTLTGMSQPTFHRTLRKLISKGLVERSDDLPIGVYTLPKQG